MDQVIKRYKCIISYDGTDFAGWQSQKIDPTIVDLMRKKFFQTFGTSVSILGASRTDAGVHALGQVAAVTTDISLPAATIKRVWNNALPESILIRSFEEADLSFNPHNNVETKTYWYHLFLDRPLPFVSRYGWYYPYPIDLSKLQRCLQAFVGTHDFRSFCTGEDMGENTIRTVDAIGFEYLKRYNAYRIAVTGPRFMRHMIRRIIGASVHIASREQISVEYIEKVFAERTPRQTLLTAPAKGLLLYTIRYSN